MATASDSPTQTIQEAIHQEDVVNETKEEEVTYKTKSIQFLGRSTPIILQNENGPCPLLAICMFFFLRVKINTTE